MAKVRPIRPANEAKLLGKNVLVFLNYGENATYETPVWALIGGQRSASYSQSADEIDLTDKVSGGYGDSEQGIKNTELEVEIIVKPGDDTITAVRDAFEKGESVDLMRWAKNGQTSRNWYSITECSEEAAYDDAAILTLTLKGQGAPTFSDNVPDPRDYGVTPTSADYSGSGDLAFDLTMPEDDDVASVKNGSTELTADTDFTFASGTLTLKSTYLAGLSGENTFKVETDNGGVLTFVVNA